jgi:hypothetical protein
VPETIGKDRIASIRKAWDGEASVDEWRRLVGAHLAVFNWKQNRFVLTIPALDALAEWNSKRQADTRTAGDGEVRS